MTKTKKKTDTVDSVDESVKAPAENEGVNETTPQEPETPEVKEPKPTNAKKKREKFLKERLEKEKSKLMELKEAVSKKKYIKGNRVSRADVLRQTMKINNTIRQIQNLK